MKYNWEDEWAEFKGLNFFGKRLSAAEKKAIKKTLNTIKLSREAKIIDIGCGSGTLLYFIKSLGYQNIIGVDVSKSAMNLCKNFGLVQGRDVFLMDILTGDFGSGEFDLVFSAGMLEHFENMTPFVEKMSKISNNYVLLIQPNHFSLWNKLVRKTAGEPVKEYSYSIEDFKKAFEKYGFKLTFQNSFNFNEQFALLFKKSRIE